MEEDNGLELSLGLSFGGYSGKVKTKDISSDPKFEEGGNSSKVVGHNTNASDVSFKSLFQTSEHNGTKAGSRSNENFWTDLGNCSTPAPNNCDSMQSSQSQFVRYQELWSANNKATVMEEEKVSNKRQLPTEEICFQKRHVKVSDHAEAVGKGPAGVTLVKKSHASVNTEDDSSGENEDVAESEAEGSNSWLVPQPEDSAKCSSKSRSTDKNVLNDPDGAALQPQKQQSYAASESNYEQGKVAYGIPLSLQPVPVMTVPYPVPVEVPASAAATSNSAGFPSNCVMRPMPVASGERSIVPALNNTNSLQVAFGYSPVQLPTLETNSSWVLGSQPQKVSSSANGESIPQQHQDDSKRTHVLLQMLSSSALVFDGKTPDLAKDMSKHVTEAGASSSSHGEEESKGTNTSYRSKETPNQPIGEGLPHELSVIRPGIAPNVKFGGSGSCPDLPWVSTTGPNGKTISGVTYKYNKNQIKIVCACHGTHMSPEEFIQHANADESNPENNNSSAFFATNNPTASAQN